MSLSDDAKTIHIALAVGLLEIVRADEEDINPKSRRSKAIGTLIDRCWNVNDCYRPEAWPPAKLEKAAAVLDKIEAVIKRHFKQ